MSGIYFVEINIGLIYYFTQLNGSLKKMLYVEKQINVCFGSPTIVILNLGLFHHYIYIKIYLPVFSLIIFS